MTSHPSLQSFPNTDEFNACQAAIATLLEDEDYERRLSEIDKTSALKEWVSLKLEQLAFRDQHIRPSNLMRDALQKAGIDFSDDDTSLYTSPTVRTYRDQLNVKWGGDDGNLEQLKQILEIYPWQKIVQDNLTFEYAHIIVQHADNHTDFLASCLQIFEQFLQDGLIQPCQEYAYLYDRVKVASKEKQKYGTQGWGKNGVWNPYEVEDPARVNEFRQHMGIWGTIETYTAFMRRLQNPEDGRDIIITYIPPTERPAPSGPRLPEPE